MAEKNIKSRDGFTIIEVVLVLAIAGLIFMMVFIALPALQRGQRDTQRRQDMSRLVTAMQNYRSLHSGKAPELTTADGQTSFLTDYLRANGDTFVDPSGDDYFFAKHNKTSVSAACSSKNGCTVPDAASNFQAGAIYVYQYATCEDENPVYKNGASSYAFTLKFEGAGTICVSN